MNWTNSVPQDNTGYIQGWWQNVFFLQGLKSHSHWGRFLNSENRESHIHSKKGKNKDLGARVWPANAHPLLTDKGDSLIF